MWLFTKYGFYSVVNARRVDGEHLGTVDPDRVVVRGRLLLHVESLKNRFHELLGSYAIEETTTASYAYRMFLPKEIWVEVLQALAEEMAYDGFTSEVAKFQRQAGKDYLKMLEEVWQVTCQNQTSQHC